MPTMDDKDLRIFACDIIQHAGIELELPQTAMTTAQMLLQRVYYTHDYTFDKYPLDITAMAALFLGTKIEECPKTARSVIDKFATILKRKFQKDIILSSSDREKVREELITAEKRLLKNLGFNLLSCYPHKIIVTRYFAITKNLDPDQNYWKENSPILQLAWNYCNDSLRTDVFIKYDEVAVACACIQLACEDTTMFFPKSSDGREWYRLFTKDDIEVKAAMETIRNLYKRKELDYYDLKRYIYLKFNRR